MGASLGVCFSRGETRGYEPLAKSEGVDKTGWLSWDNKVLLRQASKKYGKPVTLPHGAPVPFNETAAWYTPGGQDHWFEIPLCLPEMEADMGVFITGRLFTTRMPRGLDDQNSADATDMKRLKNKLKQNNLKAVFVLVEDEEPAKGLSKNLLKWYEEQGLQVFHRPIKDYNCPSLEVENKQVGDLVRNLGQGNNCLVHCWGGSGRTGTVIIGAMANLGLTNPIPHARGVKSVYLDIAEQEQFLQKQRLVITEKMAQYCPDLTKHIVYDHISDLCKADGKQLVPVDGELKESEKKVLRQMFDLADADGTGLLSVEEIVKFVSGMFPDKTHDITPQQLMAVLIQIDQEHLKGIKEFSAAHHEDRSVEFEHFLAMMKLNTPTMGASLAKTKKEVGQ